MRARAAYALAAVLLASGAAAAEDRYTWRLSFPDGTPGVLHARVAEKDGRWTVTCEYQVSQEEEMRLPDMPLGSWRGTDGEKRDRNGVRDLCLRHYDAALPRD